MTDVFDIKESTQRVFSLRKAGSLDDAIKLARDLLNKAPGDVWVHKAAAWTLHDLMKAASDAGHFEQLRELYAEFSKLTIEEDDEYLVNAAKGWKSRVPANPQEQQAKELERQGAVASKAGNHKQALVLFRQAHQLCPDNVGIATSYGWEIERALGALARDDNPSAIHVREFLHEYAKLGGIERPGLLHSVILQQAAKAAEKGAFPGFVRFLGWWGTDNLRTDDFEQHCPPGAERAFPSVVEHVVKGLHKAIKGGANNEEEIATALAFIEEHYTRYPDQEWFPYYYGQLLLKSGQLQKAQAFVLPIVRKKTGEFWAWHTLGMTYARSDSELQKACYCRALACRVKDEFFLVNVHADLGELLHAGGDDGHARAEYERATELRTGQGWKVPDNLQQILASPWLQQTAAEKTGKPFYREHGSAADALLTEGLPDLSAVAVSYSDGGKRGKPRVFVAVSTDEGLTEVLVNPKQFDCLRKVCPGTPLSVKVEAAGARLRVLACKLREGEPWDVYPDRKGVVSNVNPKKGVTAVLLSPREVCLLHHDRFGAFASTDPGAVAMLKVRKDQHRDVLIPVAAQLVDEDLPVDLCKPFSGELRINESGRFGFVGADIYVHGRTIELERLRDGCQVSGTAICEWDKKKACKSWRALKID